MGGGGVGQCIGGGGVNIVKTLTFENSGGCMTPPSSYVGAAPAPLPSPVTDVDQSIEESGACVEDSIIVFTQCMAYISLRNM